MSGLFELFILQFTFPDDDDSPTLSFQLAPDFLVAFLVAGNLGGPELRVSLGDSVILAVLVAVPEAAVDEDDGAMLGEDDVRGTGETLIVRPVAEAHVPECVTQAKLRLRGGGVNGDHVFVALFWCSCISHLPRIKQNVTKLLYPFTCTKINHVKIVVRST